MAHQTFPGQLSGNNFGTFGPFAFDCLGIGVQNPGSTWLTIPSIGGMVAPFTFGAMIAFTFPRTTPILIRTDTAPPGFHLDTSNLQTASLIFYEDQQSASAGFQAPGTGAARWALHNFPSSGVQATATRAASPGVTHVVDSIVMSYVQVATTAATVAGGWVDGASGGTILFGTQFMTDATTGHTDRMEAAPVTLRGTPGNASTVEFNAGATGYQESISATGYDQ